MSIPTKQDATIQKSVAVNPKTVVQLRQFVDSWNSIAKSRGDYDRLIALKDGEAVNATINEYTEIKKSKFQKAVTGAGASTGQGLVGTEFQPFLPILSVKGGAFQESGVLFKDNQTGSASFTSAANPGHFKAGASGSTVNNDVTSTNPFYNPIVTLSPFTAEVPFYDNPVLVNYLGGSTASLYAAFEDFLQNEKMVLADTLFANAVVSAAGVTAYPTSGATYAPIASSIVRMITDVAKYGTPTVYLNQFGLFKLIDERNNFGDGVRYPLTAQIFNDLFTVPTAGYAGQLNAGAKLFIIPTDATDSTNQTGIRNTYNTNGSNVIATSGGVPTTGGSKTAAFVGLPQYGGIAKTGNEFDTIAVFNQTNNYQMFSTGQTILGAKTHMGAAVLNPIAWEYYAF